MDSTDREILDILQEDGRASYTDIAQEIGVSEGTVRNRVENMQESGVIEKFTVEVKEPGQVRSFVSVDVSTDRGFSEIISEFPKNLGVYEIAGDMDMLVYISRESSEEVNQAVDSIRSVEGVESTQTYMVLSEKD
ncbi:MAG: Lrp/AsnC family transcriptional regulator [Candidatus Nanosalina sp.]